MGYCMNLIESTASFKVENADEILKVIKELYGKETIEDGSVIGTKEDGSYMFSDRHFRWVEEDFYKINDIKKMFEKWRWEIKKKGEKYIITGFLGEKIGDEEILFVAIAPYMNDGFIHMRGENDFHWKWLFENGVMRESKMRVILFDDDFHPEIRE